MKNIKKLKRRSQASTNLKSRNASSRGKVIRSRFPPSPVASRQKTAGLSRSTQLPSICSKTLTMSTSPATRQGTAFFTEGNELYPLPINHQVGDHASGEKRLSRGRRTRCQRLRSLH